MHVVQIELTSLCNWMCKHCYIPDTEKSTISLTEIKKTLIDLRVMGVFEITYTGGEIFLVKGFLDLLKFTRTLGFRVTLYSNTSLLNDEIIHQLYDLNISLVGCTLFSLKDEIHDSITQVKDSLKKTLHNIQLLRKYNIPVEVKCGVTKFNVYEWEKVREFCFFNGFTFTPYYDINRKNNGDITPESFRVNKEELINIIEKEKDKNLIGLFHRDNNDYAYEELRYTLSIRSDGTINPCPRLFLELGNIKQISIKNIWYESEYLKIIQSIKWGDLPECSICSQQIYCKRCPGIAFIESGNFFYKSSMNCFIAQCKCEVSNAK